MLSMMYVETKEWYSNNYDYPILFSKTRKVKRRKKEEKEREREREGVKKKQPVTIQ